MSGELGCSGLVTGLQQPHTQQWWVTNLRASRVRYPEDNAHLLWLCTTFANNNVLSMTTTIWFCWVEENRQAKDSSAKYPSRLEMSSLFSLLLCWCTQSTPSLLSDCNFLGTVLLAGWTSLQEPCHSFFFYSQLCNWPHSFLSICYSDPYIWQLFLFKACPFQVILS